jgi:hypothetical protein
VIEKNRVRRHAAPTPSELGKGQNKKKYKTKSLPAVFPYVYLPKCLLLIFMDRVIEEVYTYITRIM